LEEVNTGISVFWKLAQRKAVCIRLLLLLPARQAIGGQGLPHLKSVQLKCPGIKTQILIEAKYGNSEENLEWAD
jgi:hypothetical protein